MQHLLTQQNQFPLNVKYQKIPQVSVITITDFQVIDSK